MNYIQHLNQFLKISSKDRRLNCTHFSMYIALFHVWNGHRFANPFHVSRDELMALSHIGSKSTYTKVLDELHLFGYIRHEKPRTKYWKSRITMVRLSNPGAEHQLALFSASGEQSGKPQRVPNLARLQHPRSERQPARNEDTERTGFGTPTVPLLGHTTYKNSKDEKQRKSHAPSPPPDVTHQYSKETRAPAVQKCDALVCGQLVPISAWYPSVIISSSLLSVACRPCFPRGRPGSAFEAPSLHQVQLYFNTLSHLPGTSATPASLRQREALKFHAHYAAIGWKLGGQYPIKNWQAAAQKWWFNTRANTAAQQPPPASPSAEGYLPL